MFTILVTVNGNYINMHINMSHNYCKLFCKFHNMFYFWLFFYVLIILFYTVLICYRFGEINDYYCTF